MREFSFLGESLLEAVFWTLVYFLKPLLCYASTDDSYVHVI